MKVLLATGNHPRHNYLARILHENNALHALITETRENFIPEPPVELEPALKQCFITHFSKRERAENSIFNLTPPIIENQLIIPSDGLNSKETIDFILNSNPDIIITAGIGLIGGEVLRACPKEIWNIHGGLSPWYKGAITHFWPSYHLQPQYTGCTIHRINSGIDSGDIIHQTPAVLEEGDGLHQLSSKSLKFAFESIIPLLDLLKKQGELKSLKQGKTGKLWLKKDWHPQHLELIYGFYNDRIVDAYLQNKLYQERPNLFSQKI